MMAGTHVRAAPQRPVSPFRTPSGGPCRILELQRELAILDKQASVGLRALPAPRLQRRPAPPRRARIARRPSRPARRARSRAAPAAPRAAVRQG
jgi:hypothetical protein